MPLLVDSDNSICECESMEDKTAFEKVCMVIWALPCGLCVFFAKVIPLLCTFIFETCSNTLSGIKTFIILPCLDAIGKFFLFIYNYILSPIWFYVLVPAADICYKVGVFSFEYGIFPFWQGFVLIVEFIFSILQYMYDVFLYELVFLPLFYVLKESCRFFCDWILVPSCKGCMFSCEVIVPFISWIFEVVIGAISDGWIFLLENIFVPIGNVFSACFNCIGETILDPALSFIVALGQWSYVNIITPTQYAVGVIFEPVVTLFVSIGEFIDTKIIKPTGHLIESIIVFLTSIMNSLLRFFGIETTMQPDGERIQLRRPEGFVFNNGLFPAATNDAMEDNTHPYTEVNGDDDEESGQANYGAFLGVSTSRCTIS